MSLRWLLLLAFLALISTGVLVVIHEVADDIRPHIYAATEESTAETAALLASFVELRATQDRLPLDDLRAAMAAALRRDLSASIRGVAKRTVDLRVYVTDARGIVLYDSEDGRDEGQDYSRWNDVRLTLEGRYGARATRTDPEDPTTSVHYVAAPIRAGNRIVGVLSAGKPVRGLGAIIVGMRRQVLLAGLAALALATLMSVVLANWIALPLQQLASYAQSVAAGGRPTLPRLRGREVAALGGALEDMRTALEGKAYVESYVRSLTHEIKAPLSAIRASAELLTEEMAAEDRARFLGHIRMEAARLGSLVERMLELAEVEARASLVRCESVTASDLIADVGASVEPLAEAQGIVLDVRASDAGDLDGDPLLLRHALVNLVHNALAASPDGGHVEVACETDASTVVFSVHDRGPGIPEFALPRLFERFYSLALPGSTRRGTGLGLAFVREVAKLHGGDARLENREGGGATARLRVARHPPA